MNNGYWSFPKQLNMMEIAEMHRVIRDWDGRSPLLVKDGIEFHPFGSSSTPDAICLYCCSANLHTSTHCEKCGAGLVH